MQAFVFVGQTSRQRPSRSNHARVVVSLSAHGLAQARGRKLIAEGAAGGREYAAQKRQVLRQRAHLVIAARPHAGMYPRRNRRQMSAKPLIVSGAVRNKQARKIRAEQLEYLRL